MATKDTIQAAILTEDNNQFNRDILDGLNAFPKHLPSKYFYDAVGDKLFQAIMNSPEYYLTDCEMEIFTAQTHQLTDIINKLGRHFELIELGAGDATKSVHLLRALMNAGADFTYMPIDISENIIQHLEVTLPEMVPGIRFQGLNGEYFDMLEKACSLSDNPRVILFLGSNIGNMLPDEVHEFCAHLRNSISVGDIMIMGFDLKKNPSIIRAAYDDKAGITKQFNLNLLTRINRELSADFDIAGFDHYCTYDPETGSCKSYLIALKDMEVHFPEQTISFKRDEYIWMEISQKYTLEQIDQLAHESGFQPVKHIMDQKKWFTDAVWVAS